MESDDRIGGGGQQTETEEQRIETRSMSTNLMHTEQKKNRDLAHYILFIHVHFI